MLESTHQEIKGKIQHMKSEKYVKIIQCFFAEIQIDLDEKIGGVLKDVDGLKSDLSGSETTEIESQDTYNLVDTFKNEINKQTL